MDPITLSSLIGLGSSVFGGLMGGAEKSKQRKYNERQGEKYLQATKPKYSYFQSRALPGLNYAVQKMILGNLASRVPQEMLAKWGLDVNELTGGMGLNQPFAQTEQGRYYQQPAFGFDPARAGTSIMQKYYAAHPESDPRNPGNNPNNPYRY